VPYNPVRYPFRFHRLGPNDVVAVSESGDYAFLDQEQLELLVRAPGNLPLSTRAELQSKFFLGEKNARGMAQLLTSRVAAKRATVLGGPSLHILVVTLECAHSCSYCQVSRSLEADGFAMSIEHLNAACDCLFQSPAVRLTVEFQGGDPLLRFGLVRHAIERIATRNQIEKRAIRFVVASTLHQLTDDICSFLRQHSVFLSTSLDGPADLHNKNRPLPSQDSYERTLAGIDLARRYLGHDAVSALMTTSRHTLKHPEAVVDEYVRQRFNEIFIRPLSPYGFANRNARALGYSLDQFKVFYEQAFERVLHWNRHGVPIREVTASIVLNKILSPFDGGYVDLQTPNGAGLAVLVYNYDGFVYPSDEARMLAETGDVSLRLGSIGTPMRHLLSTPTVKKLVRSSLSRFVPGCSTCAFNTYCGPDPISAQAQFKSMDVPVHWTEHCKRQKWLFDFFFRRLKEADPWFLELAHRWSRPPGTPDAD
jgi:His-Xaa-Ser system radical SAM maturase HxsB